MLHNVTILHSIPSLVLSPLLTFFACTNKEFKRSAWSRYGYRSSMKEIGLVLIYPVAVVYCLFCFFPLVNRIPIPPPTPIPMISLIIIRCGSFMQLPIQGAPYCSLPRQLDNNCLESVWGTMALLFIL